ncbi:regulatory protein RecX [Rurimicrobium arvi]|uniref:Regulatory protein RecX n=1 Tax=Rurimicrobium arvi TaxID=2049916 RepID=A0ABP8MWK6_9BACT
MDLKSMIAKYCAYQDRCQQEVKNKLYESGASRDEVEDLLVWLIQEKFLDEERYARSFARGKFRIKNWGRRKIVYELKQHQISEYCIRKGLSEIDETEYLQTLQTLTEKKLPDLRSSGNIWAKRAKLQRYLNSKGFETELVNEMLNRYLGS